MTDEFTLIRRHFAGLTAAPDHVVLGIGDDCALLQPPPGEVLAVSTDTLVAGRHFPDGTAAFDIGWKALAVNLSDLAAMAATPRWFTLALTLPESREAWVADLAAGLKVVADAHHIALVGGDTTRGPLSLTLTVVGSVPATQALRRDGARAGDLVAVTGTLGDAALALRRWREGSVPTDDEAAFDQALRRRLDRPEARVQAGLALRGLAHAGLDLSDGLAGDLRHVCVASGVGAEIQPATLPRSKAFAALAPASVAERFALQARGGDDYELCIALLPEALPEATARLAALGLPLTVIGRFLADDGDGLEDGRGSIGSGRGIVLRHADGRREVLAGGGYDHFAADSESSSDITLRALQSATAAAPSPAAAAPSPALATASARTS